MPETLPSPAIHTGQSSRGTVMWRTVPLEKAGRDFDIAFWQSQPAATRLAAAWDLVESAWQIKGRPLDELRLQRTALHSERFPG
jgi:hypothetical protein